MRRSVANNLNDISKDHPELVVSVARRWWEGASGDRERLVRHALRTLIKAGDPGALGVLGFGADSPARVEKVHFVKANGATSPKVFKGTQKSLGPGETATVRKTISVAQHSTRTHYPGTHRVEVMLNGKTYPGVEFELR